MFIPGNTCVIKQSTGSSIITEVHKDPHPIGEKTLLVHNESGDCVGEKRVGGAIRAGVG